MIVEGLNSYQGIDENVPIGSQRDGDGTNRLCVTVGVPKIGQVTDFKSIFSQQPHADGITSLKIYTCPAGKTFYCFGVFVGNAGTTHDCNYDFTIGSGEFSGSANPTQNQPCTILGYFPVGICQSGESIVIKNNTGSAGGGVFVCNFTFWGYEEFGVTT